MHSCGRNGIFVVEKLFPKIWQYFICDSRTNSARARKDTKRIQITRTFAILSRYAWFLPSLLKKTKFRRGRISLKLDIIRSRQIGSLFVGLIFFWSVMSTEQRRGSGQPHPKLGVRLVSLWWTVFWKRKRKQKRRRKRWKRTWNWQLPHRWS